MSERISDWFKCRWVRYTYCARHGHYKVFAGYCLNCGKPVEPSEGEQR